MAKKSTAAEAPSIGREEERKWRAEDALRDIERASKHQSDPGLMRDVEKCRQDKMRDLANIKVEIAPKTIGKKK